MTPVNAERDLEKQACNKEPAPVFGWTAGQTLEGRRFPPAGAVGAASRNLLHPL
jgi:hypothetical protein